MNYHDIPPDQWARCDICGSLTPKVDIENGICVDCWDARQFIANFEAGLTEDDNDDV